MKASDVLFCIFNYHEAENAEFLYRELSTSFDCHIIDADSGERPADFGGATVYLPNVYYGGMMHHAIRMGEIGDYPYLFFICSDVHISHESLERLTQILLSESFDGVGVYCPCHADDSYTWASSSYSRQGGKRRKVAFIEGMLGMYSREVYSHLAPFDDNPHGWGIDIVACFFARDLGMSCEVDDRLTITHPKGDVKKNDLARNEARAYIMRYSEGIMIRLYWVLCSLRYATIQPFILPKSYRKWLKFFLPIYRFFHRH